MTSNGQLLPELLPTGPEVDSATCAMLKRLKSLLISLTGGPSTKELNYLQNVAIAGSGFSHLYLRDNFIFSKCFPLFCYYYLCHLAVN